MSQNLQKLAFFNKPVHKHLKPFTSSMHTPFIHGDEEQSSIFDSQYFPMKPSLH